MPRSKTKVDKKKVGSYFKVPVPDFKNDDHECNTNVFFQACFYLSFMVWEHHFTQFYTFDEVWGIADQTYENDKETGKYDTDKETHDGFREVMEKVDPSLFCWYNYFFLQLLQDDKTSGKPKAS